MTQDPYQNDENKLQLSADLDTDLTGGYAELDDQPEPFERQAKKRPVALIVLLVIALGGTGAFFAYDMFLNKEEVFVPPAKLVDLAPPAAPVAPEAATPAPVDPLAENAAPGTEVVPGTEAIATNENPAPVIDPNAPSTDAAALPVAPAVTDNSAMPTPEQQLQPIDANDVLAKANNEAAPIAVPSALPVSAAEKKTADTIAAVNEILGKETIPTPAANAVSVNNAAAVGGPPAEIVSRAQQVIKVTKTYSAQSSQAAIAAGDRVLNDNQYDSAIQIFDKQLRNNPSDPSALAGKAMALQRVNRDAEALTTYERLISLNPRDLDALTNYLGLLQKQNPEKAMSRLNTLSEQYPDNAAVAGQIAAVFAGQQDTPNALRYFMKAKALDATNPTYPMNIGILYDRMGNSDKAGEFYRSALSTAKNYPNQVSEQTMEKVSNRLRNLN